MLQGLSSVQHEIAEMSLASEEAKRRDSVENSKSLPPQKPPYVLISLGVLAYLGRRWAGNGFGECEFEHLDQQAFSLSLSSGRAQ